MREIKEYMKEQYLRLNKIYQTTLTENDLKHLYNFVNEHLLDSHAACDLIEISLRLEKLKEVEVKESLTEEDIKKYIKEQAIRIGEHYNYVVGYWVEGEGQCVCDNEGSYINPITLPQARKLSKEINREYGKTKYKSVIYKLVRVK